VSIRQGQRISSLKAGSNFLTASGRRVLATGLSRKLRAPMLSEMTDPLPPPPITPQHSSPTRSDSAFKKAS
jgi:hypothetical protein